MRLAAEKVWFREPWLVKIGSCTYKLIGQAGLLGQNHLGLCIAKERIGGVKCESFPEQLANSIGSKQCIGFFFFFLSPSTLRWFLKSGTNETIVLESHLR